VYYHILGLTYLLKGDSANAKESFTESLKLNPEFPQARRELDKLNKKQ
jgi:Tfp pilus assembly protein PilF